MRDLTKEEAEALDTMQDVCRVWLETPRWRRPSPDALGKIIAATLLLLSECAVHAEESMEERKKIALKYFPSTMRMIPRDVDPKDRDCGKVHINRCKNETIK